MLRLISFTLLILATTPYLSAFDTYSYPTDTIFINPNAVGSSETGTRENPWLGLRPDSQMPSGFVYAFKGGTTLYTNQSNEYHNKQVFVITSYDTTGVGLARIYKTNKQGRIFHITGASLGNNIPDTNTRIKVSNIILYHSGRHLNDGIGAALSIRLFGGRAHVNNVHTTGGHQGISINSYSVPDIAHVLIENCTIDSTFDDSMYLTQLRSVWVRNTKATNAGLFWQDHPVQASGDNLHTWQTRTVKIENSTLDRRGNGGKFAIIGTETTEQVHIRNTIMIGHFIHNNPGIDSLTATIYKGNGHWIFENSIIIDGVYGIWNHGLSLNIDNCLFVGQNISINGLNAVNEIHNSTFANIGTNTHIWPNNSVFYNAWGSQSLNVSNSNFYNYNRLFLSMGGSNLSVNFNGNNYYNYNVDESNHWWGYGSNATMHNPQFAETIFYQLSPGSPLRNAGPGGRNVGFCLDVAGSVGYKPITGNSGTDPEVPPTWNVGFNVTGANNAAITNATITFNGHTNPAGSYSFPNTPSGTHTYSVSAPHHQTLSGQSVTVANHMTIPVTLTPVSYNVTITASPSAGGTFTGNGSYAYGQSATVTATPAAGYNFVNWTVNGNPVSTQASYTFTVTGNRNLVANFSQNTYSVSLSSSPAAGGTTTGAGNYNHGQTATVTATANTGFSFINWTENGTPVSSQAFYAFTVNGNRNLVANFNANAYSLTVNAVPLNGGTVSGSGVFAHGQSVTVSAQAAQGYAFNSWTINGQAVSSNPVYSFTITDNTVISANFQQQQQFTVSTQSQPLQGGYTTGQGSFYANQTATLEAVPYPGYNFLHWQYQNLIYSNQPEISVTVNSDMHFTAVFSAASAQVAVLVDVTPTGFGFINGTGTYIQGQNVTLQANSIDATIAFIGYYENGELLETSPEITFIADDNRQIQALFRHFSRDFEVKASLATPAFQNIVEIHGAGSYPEGETASLSVTISDQVTFVGWQNKAGQIVSRMNPYVFEVNRNVELEAILRAGPVQAATERISPNPSNGQFNLSLQEDSEVNIFNANGVLLYSRYMLAGNNPVDLPDLPTGLYLVQIKNQQKTETQRLIIKY